MATRKQIDDLQGLNTVSAPATSVQGAIAFAPRDNPLLDLAQNLKSVNRSLGEYADKVVERENKAAVEEGKRLAMMDDAKSFKEYVEKGGDPMASPWVVYGYKQQKGRVLGQSYQAFVADKKLNWEGSGSDDIDGQALVDVLPKWRQEFLQQQGELDDVEYTGFDAYAVPEEDNMLRQHIAESRQVATENMKTQVYNEFYGLLNTKGLTEEQMFAKFDEIYNRQDFIGLRREVGPQLLQAVNDFAVETGDTDIIDIVSKYSRKDAKTGQTIPVLKNTKATAVLQKARNDALRSSVILDNSRRQKQEDAERDVTKTSVGDLVKEVAAGNKPANPFEFAAKVAQAGGNAADALSAAASVNNVFENVKTRRSSELVTDIYAELMSGNPTKSRIEYIKEVSAVGDKNDLAAVNNLWDTFVAEGKTVFSEYPELEMYAQQLNLGGTPQETQQSMRDVAQATRTALAAKTKPEDLVKKVKELTKSIQDERAKKLEDTFAPIPDSNVDTNGIPTGGKKPATPGATKPQAAGGQVLQPVATMAEIAAMRGKPRADVDRLLQLKPLLPPSIMAVGMRQIAAQTNSPEANAVIRVMAAAGLDTSNPRRALAEFLQRGQRKFYATASRTPQQK